MINIYEDAAPTILRQHVNGHEGFVILPEGEDDDGIYFENWETLTGWLTALAGQIVDVDPADLQWYDDWLPSSD